MARNRLTAVRLVVAAFAVIAAGLVVAGLNPSAFCASDQPKVAQVNATCEESNPIDVLAKDDSNGTQSLDQVDKDVTACRIAPECWANSDCDAICGAAGGRCVHNKCPIRICKCN